MAVTKKLALWVFNALQHNYTHKELAYNHILVFLQNQSQNYNFAIRTKVYTSSETGQPSLLLNLYGSISLGDSIQAPVEIWIPYNYPSGFSSPSNSYNSTGNVNGQSDPLFDANGSVPIVYIIPDHSKNYYLRAGNYVDTLGRFYHPYLASWYQESSSHPSNPNAPISARYELLQLIKVVAEALRAEPPIYSIYEASLPQAIMQPQASGSQQSSNYQSGPSLPPQIPISHNQNQPIKPQSPLQQQSTLSSQQFNPSVQQLTSSYTGGSNTSGYTSPPPNGPPLPPKPPKLPKTPGENPSPSPSTGGHRTTSTSEAAQLPSFGNPVEKQTPGSRYSPLGPSQASQNPVHNQPPNFQSVNNASFIPQFTGSSLVQFAQQSDSNGPPPLPQKPYKPSGESRMEQRAVVSEYRNATPVLKDASPGYNSATPVYDSVPERYRSPPSLPSEQSYQNNYQTVDIRSPSESPRYTPKPAYVRQVREQPSYSPSPNSLGQMHISPSPGAQYAPVTTAASVPVLHAPPVDLLSDGTDGPLTDTASNAERRQVLEQLSAKFNLFLNDAYNDNIDNSLPKVRETHQKVEALYSQLSHIYQQAVENSRSLDGHIAYLTQQVNNITILNQDLVKLDEINSESPDSVTTAPGTKTPLDNLIIPDLPLVRQLYETVLEIKAVRDTINLVSGSFHSEKELINDARMDLCVKTVRNLGRELFWLELTKQEIAHNIMGLSLN